MTGFFELSKPQLAMIYAAATEREFNPKTFNTTSNGQRRTEAALRDMGLTPDDAFNVLLNMVERGDEITPQSLRATLLAAADKSAFEADSEDGDAASEEAEETVTEEIAATEPAPTNVRPLKGTSEKHRKLADMLCRPEGATAREIMAAFNWSICTGRIAEAKKALGLTIRRVKEGSDTRYFAMPRGGTVVAGITH